MKHKTRTYSPKAKRIANLLAGGKKTPSSSALSKIKTIPGDLLGKVRVSGGIVIVEGSLNGNIMRLQRQVPLGPDGIEVKPGEQLIVKGDVYGDIEAENSHVRVKGDVFGGVDPHIPYVKVTIDGHSHDSSQDKQRAKTPPTDVSKSTPDEGKVEVVTLIQSSIQKDYGNYLIVYTHSFRKLIKGQRDSVKPTEKEVTQFMHDVAEAAENNREVAIFVAANPNMRF